MNLAKSGHYNLAATNGPGDHQHYVNSCVRHDTSLQLTNMRGHLPAPDVPSRTRRQQHGIAGDEVSQALKKGIFVRFVHFLVVSCTAKRAGKDRASRVRLEISDEPVCYPVR
ncbi:hypothetical protein [Burkholderia ubonensis]|uniref:hypothetical protein n=1 Tax=Burkholderia ubonensis TaxID=101571 RepID=UPI0018E056C0|nr:hypothetical protein [Burkholderia ubonensis]